MQLPDTVSETQFLNAVEYIGRVLVRKFSFPGADKDDVLQQIALWSWEALPRFRPEAGSLESYLYSHCRNRCLNKARDEVARTSDPPCRSCHAGTPCGPDGEVCSKYRAWSERNQAKARLSRPLGLDKMSDEHESRMTKDSSVEADAAHRELLDLIDAHLPISIRSDYLMMVAGATHLVSIQRRRVVQREVAVILEEAGVELPEGVAELLKEGGKGKRGAGATEDEEPADMPTGRPMTSGPGVADDY